MAPSITVHLQIFKRPQLLRFSTNLDETGVKIHGLLRSFIYNIVVVGHRLEIIIDHRLESVAAVDAIF